MSVKYTRDGTEYRFYTCPGSVDAIGQLTMIADVYEDLGIKPVLVTLRSVDGLSLGRLADDKPKVEPGAVLLCSNTDGIDDEARDVLRAYCVRNRVKTVVVVTARASDHT